MAATRPKLAVIVTTYGPGSHGDCLATKFLEGLEFDTHTDPPRGDVVAMNLIEIARDDIGLELAKKHNVSLHHTIASALCRGGDELAVDGVVVIGEHGTYPRTPQGLQLYPRREFFDQVVGVFRQSGRVVPVFNDKHMSWNWPWAKYMWRTIQELKIPWMAGSSLPYAPFDPMVELPRGRKIDHLIAVGYGGLESYGFHAIETGQFIIEQRAGGEVGLKSVQVISGENVWNAHEAGRWPRDLAAAALGVVKRPNGRPQDHKTFHAFDFEYRDGQRMTVFMANGYCSEFAFAWRERGKSQVHAGSYFLDPRPRRKHFSALVRSLEDMFLTGKPTEPGERTYLTTGALSYVMESYNRGGVKLETPDLTSATNRRAGRRRGRKCYGEWRLAAR